MNHDYTQEELLVEHESPSLRKRKSRERHSQSQIHDQFADESEEEKKIEAKPLSLARRKTLRARRSSLFVTKKMMT